MDAKKKAIIAEMKRHLAEMRRRGTSSASSRGSG
jgi:hypothetical protein